MTPELYTKVVELEREFQRIAKQERERAAGDIYEFVHNFNEFLNLKQRL